MDEQLYAIPVNDAFNEDTECPVCSMYASLQKNAIEFTMGPSYMEDDVRMETNEVGFCAKHVEMMYGNQNRLGLGLMLHTHMQNLIKETEKAQKKGRSSGGGFFKKNTEGSAVSAYMRQVKNSCYICNHIENIFERYIDTIFYLYEKDSAFKAKFDASKGFCVDHYQILYDAADSHMSGNALKDFTAKIDKLFLENMKRVCDDVEWYTDKFDYRNKDADWKNSKDALIRAIKKLDSIELQL